MNASDYEIQKTLLETSRFTLFRARHIRTGASVLLKSLTEAGQLAGKGPSGAAPPLASSRGRRPGVAGVVDPVGVGGRSTIVLEDFGGEPLGEQGDEPMTLERVLLIALQVAKAVEAAYASGRRCDPDCLDRVLVNPSTGEARLIDALPFPCTPCEAEPTTERGAPPQELHRRLGELMHELLSARAAAGESSDPEPAAGPPIPPIVQRIVARLRASGSEPRYRTSRGVTADLRRCLDACRDGSAADFPLGEQDLPATLPMSTRLVGRQEEVRRAQAVFAQAARGAAKLLVVSGNSGVGKSSLIGQLCRPIAEAKGRFVTGKCDPLDIRTPHGALLLALRQLVKCVLSERGEQREVWRRRLEQSFGANLGVLARALPEVRDLVGPTDPPAELEAHEAKNRFERVIARFLRLFAVRQAPLVVFLDDVQWTDSSTPELLSNLLVDHDLESLLFVLAYRIEDVDESHPVQQMLDHLANQPHACTERVTLRPLTTEGVSAMVASVLRCREEQARELSALIADKAEGNPFVVRELLSDLHRQKVLRFSAEVGHWTHDLHAARHALAESDVTNLVKSRLARLPQCCLSALSHAACLGGHFTISGLAELMGLSTEDALGRLLEAVRQGFVVSVPFRRADSKPNAPPDSERHDTLYRFRHDRVQQAAYAAMPEQERRRTHLKIGAKLLEQGAPVPEGSQLFELVNHLNLGRQCIQSEADLERLAFLDELAGQYAHRATAHGLAADYFQIAADLLRRLTPQSRPDALRRVQSRQVECLVMAGKVQAASQLCTASFDLASTPRELAELHLLETRVLEARAQFDQAVSSARRGLHELGIDVPQDASVIEHQIAEGIRLLQRHTAEPTEQALARLPEMTDPDKVIAMKLLFRAIPSAIQTSPRLFLLLELTMFDLTMQHGLTAVSAKNIVDCGIIVGGILGDHDKAYELAQAAFAMLERFKSRAIASSVNFAFATYISSWRAGPAEALAAFDEGHRLALETGDLQHMGFCTTLRMHRLLHLGRDLRDCERQLASAIATVERAELPSQRIGLIQVERAIARLRTPGLTAAQEDAPTEAVMACRNPQWIYAYAQSQMVVSVFLGEHEQAMRWRELARERLSDAAGLISVPEFHTVDALLQSQYEFARSTPEGKATILQNLERIEEQLHGWADGCPENFAHKYHLVAAERARLRGEPLSDVLDQYERAVTTTGNEYSHFHALALECQATVWQERGNAAFATTLRQQAGALYRRWGADAKVEALAGEVERSEIDEAARRGADAPAAALATKLLLGAVSSSDLLTRLVEISMETARAERSVLVRAGESAEGTLPVLAAGRSGRQPGRPEITLPPLPPLAEYCPEAAPLVRRVLRTGTPLVSPQHEIAMPLRHAGRLLGVLFIDGYDTAELAKTCLQALKPLREGASLCLLHAEERGQLERALRSQALELQETKARLDRLSRATPEEDGPPRPLEETEDEPPEPELPKPSAPPS